MLAMLNVKLPPPSPAVAATVNISQNESRAAARKGEPKRGDRSAAALKMVQLRPPIMAGAKAYNNRASSRSILAALRA